jgi:hypothetical protein
MRRLIVAGAVALSVTLAIGFTWAPRGQVVNAKGDPNVTIVNTTSLLYRTPPGSLGVANGVITVVASIDVHAFGQIRVAAGNRCGSPQPLMLLLTHQDGSELVVTMDSITLAPCASFSKSYDVPGTLIAIQTDQRAVPSGSTDNFDLVFYGHN